MLTAAYASSITLEPHSRSMMCNMNPLERFLAHVQVAQSVGDTLLTGGFLNHRVDVIALSGAAGALATRVPNADILLTAESGGIAPAFALAQAMNKPFVFARRSNARVPGEIVQVRVGDLDPNVAETDDDQHLIVARDALQPGSRVLLVDDILGHGRTPLALSRLAGMAGTQVVGLAVFIEKTFQGGRNRLEVQGVPVHSLVRFASNGTELFLERRVGQE
jgi:xanthine phosphoribosyltransferase